MDRHELLVHLLHGFQPSIPLVAGHNLDPLETFDDRFVQKLIVLAFLDLSFLKANGSFPTQRESRAHVSLLGMIGV